MRKIKKLIIGVLIVEFFFIFPCFTIQLGRMNLSINSEAIGNKYIRPILSAGKSIKYEWNYTWGGEEDDRGSGVAVDSLDNVYIVGWTESFGAEFYDMVLVKYDGNGVQQWNHTWGESVYDLGNCVTVDSLDNVYIAGSTGLIKYNADGVQLWNRTWDGDPIDDCSGIALDSLDNIYLAGSTYNSEAGNTDMVLVKYDREGQQQWNCTWGGGDDDSDHGVAVDSLDNIYFVGSTKSLGVGGWDIVLVKYNENGVLKWNHTWGGNEDDMAEGVVTDSFGNVYFTGYNIISGSGTESADMVLVKYDENGVQQWNHTWSEGGYRSYSANLGFGLNVDSSNNLYLVGAIHDRGIPTKGWDMVLVKCDGNGVQQWNQTWGGAGGDACRGITIDSLGNIYLAGHTNSYGMGLEDMILVKFSEIKQHPPDELIISIMIVVPVASIIVVSIVIIYFVSKRRHIAE